MEKYEFIDDISKLYPERMNDENVEHMKSFEHGERMEEMRRNMIKNKLARFRLRKRYDHHNSEYDMEARCAIAHYDHSHYAYHIILWSVIGFNVFMTYIIGILGSGVYCSAVGHRKLGLKVAAIVLIIQQLFVLFSSAFWTWKFTYDVMKDNRHEEHHNSYFKGRIAVGFLMFALLAVSWIIHLVHSFAACCCTPTEDEETIKIVKVKKDTSDDRLKLVDNVVFGERVFDNDGEIA